MSQTIPMIEETPIIEATSMIETTPVTETTTTTTTTTTTPTTETTTTTTTTTIIPTETILTAPILKHPKNSSRYFIVRQGEEEVEICLTKPESEKHFMEFSFTTTVLRESYKTQIVTVVCSCYVKCFCAHNKCKHAKQQDQYPLNSLATKIMSGLYSEDFGKYWISGDCCFMIGSGKMTAKQFKVFSTDMR
jgi:hypothetical protein